MRILLIIGFYLLGLDAIGSMIAAKIESMHYLIRFFDNHTK